jgi:hypothetical protein
LYFQTRPVSVIISASTSRTQLFSDIVLHRFIENIFYILTNRMKKYTKQNCICGTPIKICFTCEAPYSFFKLLNCSRFSEDRVWGFRIGSRRGRGLRRWRHPDRFPLLVRTGFRRSKGREKKEEQMS